MKLFVDVCKALSDPNRVKIIKILQYKVMCVCEITRALELAQPTVSKHLKVLEAAGLVRSSRDEKWINYALADGGHSPYAATLLGSLRHWMEDDPDIKALISSLPLIRREDICC